jgi:uncharacterized membrane protein
VCTLKVCTGSYTQIFSLTALWQAKLRKLSRAARAGIKGTHSAPCVRLSCEDRMCVRTGVLHACGFGLCVQVCVYGTRLVSVRDASRCVVLV